MWLDDVFTPCVFGRALGTGTSTTLRPLFLAQRA